MRRRLSSKKKLYIRRFYPAGNYTWTVPNGCTEVEVFLVGAGGGGSTAAGGGGGYTKTYKKATTGWRDGDAVKVQAGDIISIVVGAGGLDNGSPYAYLPGHNGGYSQFLNSKYRAMGGTTGLSSCYANGGNGGSGGGCYPKSQGHSNDGTRGASDGAAAESSPDYYGGRGQGHTTREFGEYNNTLYSGGGGGGGRDTDPSIPPMPNGEGEIGQGGQGGWKEYQCSQSGKDGIVIIRYWI